MKQLIRCAALLFACAGSDDEPRGRRTPTPFPDSTPTPAQADGQCADGAWARCLCDESLLAVECTTDLQQIYYDRCVSGTSPALRCLAGSFVSREQPPDLSGCLYCYAPTPSEEKSSGDVGDGGSVPAR